MPTAERTRPAARRGDGRVPPHNIQAEQSCLGSMLISPAAAKTAIAFGLTPGDFYRPAHQHIFDAINNLVSVEIPTDVVIVSDELRAAGLLDDIGDAASGNYGSAYLLQLQNDSPAISNITRYAGIVKQTSTLRRMIGLAADIAEIAYNEPDDVDLAIADAEIRLLELASSTGPRENRIAAKVLVGDQIHTVPRPEPLIAGIIHRRGLSVVFGRPGACKSFLALDWAASIATGAWWFGREVHKGPALYVIAEGAEGMGDRVDAWKAARNIRNVNDLHWLPDTVNLFNPVEVNELIGYVSGRGYEIIVIDTLARSMAGADEISGKDLGVIIDSVDRIRRASGAAVVLVHHTNMRGEDMRGHTALRGAIDTAIKVGQTDHIVKIECDKQKNSAEFDPITLSLVDCVDSAVLVPGTTRPDVDDERTSARMVEMMRVLESLDSGSGVPAGLWKETCDTELGLGKSTFFKVVKLLNVQGYIEGAKGAGRAPWMLSDLGKDTLEPVPGKVQRTKSQKHPSDGLQSPESPPPPTDNDAPPDQEEPGKVHKVQQVQTGPVQKVQSSPSLIGEDGMDFATDTGPEDDAR